MNNKMAGIDKNNCAIIQNMLTSVALLYFDNNKDLINKSKTENFKRKQ